MGVNQKKLAERAELKRADQRAADERAAKRDAERAAIETFHKTNSGPWSEDEHKLLLSAIQLYGTKWKKVAQVVKTRTIKQAKSHAQKRVPSKNLRAAAEKVDKAKRAESERGADRREKNSLKEELLKEP